MRLESYKDSDDFRCPACDVGLDIDLIYEDPGTLIYKETKPCPVCNALIEIDQHIVTTARIV